MLKVLLKGTHRYQSRYDLTELENASDVSERSLLFSDQGTIAARSNNTIGYRVCCNSHYSSMFLSTQSVLMLG